MHAINGRARSWPTIVALSTALFLLGVGGSIASGARAPALGLVGAAPSAPLATQPIVQLDVIGTFRDGTVLNQTGYGVVVDPSGLILAPAGIVAPDAPGVAVAYENPFVVGTVTQIVIGMSPSAEVLPVPAYTGKVLAVDGYLDIAVIAPDATYAGSGTTPTPITPGSLTLPAMPISAALPAAGSAATFGGYLQPGGAFGTTAPTWTELAGKFVAPASDPRITSGPGWLPTDIPPPTGHPAGVLADSTGSLVGFASWSPLGNPTVVAGRPISLIQPIIDAAKNGTPYTSMFVPPGTGAEALTFDSWVDGANACNGGPKKVTTYPSGAARIAATWTYTGMTDGEDMYSYWFDPVAQQLLLTSPDKWNAGAQGTCLGLSVSTSSGALPDGDYAVAVHVGPQLKLVGNAQTKVGGTTTPGGITVHGRIVNADTGVGVTAALVVVLKPGTDIQGWLNNPDKAQVAASGLSDATGAYSTAPPLAAGTYPFLVVAAGYQVIGGTLTIQGTGQLSDIQLVASQ